MLDWLEQRNAEQIAALSDRAVTDPTKLKPDELTDALQQLGARLAALHGDAVAPDDIVGVTRRLTDAEVADLQARTQQDLEAKHQALLDAFARLDHVRALSDSRSAAEF